MLQLDQISTLAFGGLVLLLGYALRRAIPPLGRCNLPAPVIGGLVVAVAMLAARNWDLDLVKFDRTLEKPLMSAFFTTVGFGASFNLLRTGGRPVLFFFLLSTIAALLQNLVGAATAVAVGQPALFGVLCGSVTLTGGPATGLAFAPQFEQAGVIGAEPIAAASAMFGIVAGGLIGAPIATALLASLNRRRTEGAVPPTPTAEQVVERQLPAPVESVPVGEDVESYVLLKTVGVILMAMWLGAELSAWLTAHVLTLPFYIGGMLVAAALRNLDDATGWLGLNQATIDDVGNVALSFFLAVALMTLELWKLAAVAGPLAAVLVVQILLVAAYSVWPVFARMGRNYDSAVIAGGFCGFMMGTTANAMATMDAIVKRYGPSPMAYLVVPMVGAFFIDFTNALLIQGCLNVFG